MPANSFHSSKMQNRRKYLRQRLREFLPAGLKLDTRNRRIDVPHDFEPDTLPEQARPYWRELVGTHGYVAQQFIAS